MTIKNYIEFIKESYGKSLHDLLDRGDVKQNEVSELISNGADIEEKDKAGWTPLMKAVHYEENIAVEELLENGADYNVETIYGTSPIGMVDNDIIFDLLINNGAKINGKIPERYFDARNRTILNNNVKIISKYLYNGSDINMKYFSKYYIYIHKNEIFQKAILDNMPYNTIYIKEYLTSNIKKEFKDILDMEEIGLL